jgi:hypothetical protein
MSRFASDRARKNLFVALPLGAGLVASGCSDDSTAPEDPPVGTVVVQFDHVATGLSGSGPLAFDQMIYRNAAGNDFSVTKLQYLVSRFRLEPEASLRATAEYESDVVHFRDGRDDATRTVTFTDVPGGDYDHLSFVFGLTNDDNVTGAYPDYDAAMNWPMGMGGYHYMKCEGMWGNGPSNFATHTGRSMDAKDRSFEVSLDLNAVPLRHGFTLAEGETKTIRVAMNLNQWYQDPNVYDFVDYGMIMGNPVAQELIHENGSPDHGTGVFSYVP